MLQVRSSARGWSVLRKAAAAAAIDLQTFSA